MAAEIGCAVRNSAEQPLAACDATDESGGQRLPVLVRTEKLGGFGDGLEDIVRS